MDIDLGVDGLDVTSAAFSPDGANVLILVSRSTVKVWNLKTRSVTTSPFARNAAYRGAAFSPDGQHIIVTGDDGDVRVWSLTTGEVAQLVSQDASSPNRRCGAADFPAAYSGDSQQIVYALADCSIHMRTIRSGAEISFTPCTDQRVSLVAFSPDNTRLAIACADGNLSIWNTATGARVTMPVAASAPDSLQTMVFTRDGNGILSVDWHGIVTVWKLTANTITAVSRVDSIIFNSYGIVQRAAFSRDGKYLALSYVDDFKFFQGVEIGDFEIAILSADLYGSVDDLLTIADARMSGTTPK
jgi:WD40 repeat protein